MFGDGREKTVFACVEERPVSSRTRREDAHDFAADQLLSWTRLLHLIANRDFESATNQPREVAFRGVVGDSTHGNGLPLFAVARSERDLQFARGGDRIFVKKFVEVAEAEEQQRVRIARLDG